MATKATTKPALKKVPKAKPTTSSVTRDKAGEVVVPLPMRRKMAQYLEKKAEMAALDLEVKAIGKEIFGFVDGTGDKTVIAEGARFTVVTGNTSKRDDDKLKELIGLTAWNKITTRKVEEKLLEVAVADGKIPLKAVADATTIVPRTPFLKATKA